MNPNQPKKDIRCAVCRAEFVSSLLKENQTKECPVCKTLIPPLKIADDGYVMLNWQDIRVLAIYAQRWAGRFDMTSKGNVDSIQVLKGIVEHLKIYQPKTGGTLDAELIAEKEIGIPSPYIRNLWKQ
jgi:hypothetical protein